MVSEKCLHAYWKKYRNTDSPFSKARMFYLEPGNSLRIEMDGVLYEQPMDETDESFMERLRRCTPERNVFLEEWPIDTFDYANSPYIF